MGCMALAPALQKMWRQCMGGPRSEAGSEYRHDVAQFMLTFGEDAVFVGMPYSSLESVSSTTNDCNKNILDLFTTPHKKEKHCNTQPTIN